MLRTVSRSARRWLAIAAMAGLGAATLLPVGVAWAQHDNHGHAPAGHDPVPGKTPAHKNDAHAGDAHGAADGGHHGPGHINWVYGLLSEKEGLKEPDLLFRPKGMPAPFLANVINFGIVLLILVTKAGPAVRKGLLDRRDDLLRDSEAAAKRLAEAQERYQEQKGRNDRIAEEVARIKADYIEQGKREIERIERDARERHERMIRDARLLIEQEGRALRQRALNNAVEAATQRAQTVLTGQINSTDQERLANEYLAQLGPMQIKRGEA